MDRMTEAGKLQYVISQHIGWLKSYMALMTPENWRDMRDRSGHQLDQLSDDFDELSAALSAAKEDQ